MVALIVIVALAVLGGGGCMMCLCLGAAGSAGSSKPSGPSKPAPAVNLTQIPVSFSGRTDSSSVRTGGVVALRFRLRNNGSTPINGFELACYSCDDITFIGAPAGNIEKRFSGKYVAYYMTVAPGAEVAPVLTISPQKAGNIDVNIELKGSGSQRLQAGNAQMLTFDLAVF